MIITAPFTTLQASSIKGLSVVNFAPVTALDNGKITVILKGEIRARISALFKLVRSQVRTENRLFKLVSSQVSTDIILLLLVTKKEVATLVATEKATYNHAHQERKIFSLASNQGFIDITTRAREAKDYHRISNKVINLTRISKVFTKIGKVDNEFSDILGNEFRTSIKKDNKIVSCVHKKGNYLADLANFSRQAFFTQAEKLLFSFFASCSICSSKSSSKRICFVVLLDRSKNFFSFLSCIGSYRYDRLNLKGSYHYIGYYLKKAIPRSASTLSRDLTQPLTEVMIMANRYDSAHLRVEQSKLFTFYNGLTSQLVRTIAITDQQARQNLSNINLTFISRKPLAMGVNHGK
ncbi:hypothetical protein [Orbus wheelerorum]